MRMSSNYFEEVHSGSWWRARGDQPLLNRTRCRVLSKLASGRGMLLDVGSGEGYFARHAQAAGWRVIALDYLPAGVSASHALLTGGVARADSLHLPVRAGAVDIVTLWDVLEHLHDPVEGLRECARVLKPGGLLGLSTPNTEALSVRRRGKQSVQFSDPTHISIATPAIWRARIEECGFTIVVAGGDAWWDPPYRFPLPRPVWTGVSQAMFGTRLAWPIKTGENLVFVARRQ